MINKYILREGIHTPFSNFKMQSFDGNFTTGGSYNGNPNTKKKKNWFEETPDYLLYLYQTYPFLNQDFNIDGSNNLYSDISGTNPNNINTENPFEENNQKTAETIGKVGEVIGDTLKSIGEKNTNNISSIFSQNALSSLNANGNMARALGFSSSSVLKGDLMDSSKTINNFRNQFNNQTTNLTGTKSIEERLFDTATGKSKTSYDKLSTGLGYASLGLSTLGQSGVLGEDGSKIASTAGTIAEAASPLLQNGIKGTDLTSTAGNVIGSMLGTSNNSVVRAGGQLLGSTDTIINSIKGLSSANRITNMTKGAKDALAAGANAKDAATAGRAAANSAQAANVMNLASIGIGVADTALFGNQTPSEYSGKKGGITQGLDIAYDAIQAGIAFVPVIGTAASLIMAGNKFLGHGIKAMGGGTDGMTTGDAILGSSFMQATPLGMINGFGGSSTTNWTKDEDVYSKVGGSYLGSNAMADEVSPYAGKKFGLFSSGSRKKWEKKIQEGIRQEKMLRLIGNESERNKTLAQTMTNVNSQALNNILNGGYENTITFKKGGIFEMFGDKLKRANRIIIETKKTIIIEPKEEKKQEETKNVIPEGALHANLNHMDTKDITKKGIPVVDTEGKQQAEIERNEIIFRLEVTQLIENLKKDGSDEAAIKAGKLLTKEILHNTEDRTRLIDLFKQGGEILIAESGTKIEELSEVPDTETMLQDWINRKIQERTEAAIKKATTRELPYMFKNPNWANCIATATDNYGIPIVLRNTDLMKDPNKYGFEELEFGDTTDNLPDGVLLQDFNKPKDPKTPGHTIMLVGRTETGAPVYSYSSGRSTKESMHNNDTSYRFARWDSKTKPKAYRYIGTPSERKQWEDEFYKEYPQLKVQLIEEIPEHKNGGTVNVIPEGNLHARLHHMEDAEGLTKKGIPVIDNDGDQLAEIELNEIIFRLEVTKKLEELSKKEDKDEAALEAGKLLVDEILNNTDDRTGLIKTI